MKPLRLVFAAMFATAALSACAPEADTASEAEMGNEMTDDEGAMSPPVTAPGEDALPDDAQYGEGGQIGAEPVTAEEASEPENLQDDGTEVENY